MNQSIQKIIRYICFFVGIILLINTSVAIAEYKGLGNVDELIWDGTISIEVNGSDYINKDKDLKTVTTKYSRTRKIKGSVLLTICGYSTDLVVKKVDWHYRYTDHEDEESVAKKTYCFDPVSKKRRAVSPGSSNRKKIRITIGDHKSLDCENQEDMVQIFLLLFPGGTYALDAFSYVHTKNIEYTETVIKDNACGDLPVEKTLTISTTSCLGEESSNIDPSGLNTTIVQRPGRYPLNFGGYVKGYIEGDNVIQGSMAPKKIDENAKYSPMISATWYLKGTLKCKKIYEQMMMDIAMAEAFTDINLQKRAKDMDDYKNLVEELARANYGSNSGSTGISNPDEADLATDMGTSASCKIIGYEKYKEEVRNKCLPKIIYNAALTHEKKHVSQCKTNHTAFVHGAGDPYTRALMEIPAYLAGIEKLLKWLEKNCKDTDLSNAISRINSLKALPIHFYD